MKKTLFILTTLFVSVAGFAKETKFVTVNLKNEAKKETILNELKQYGITEKDLNSIKDLDIRSAVSVMIEKGNSGYTLTFSE